MNIIKPLRLGLFHRTYQVRNRNYLAVTGLTFADFDTPTELLSEQALWPFVMEQLGEDPIFDLGMPKPRGEVLVYGTANAPGGTPVKAMDVAIGVGSLHKTLRVVGDRQWGWDSNIQDLAPSPPQPFTSLALTYAQAFGGPAFARNPRGLGHDPRRRLQAGEPAPLPNIEHPGAPIRRIEDTPDPAGFAALDILWPQRQGRAGTYDDSWLAERYPGLADDIDWTVFNAAPSDQWFEGFPDGDEAVAVRGFHPDRPEDGTRLPGMLLRAFVTSAHPGSDDDDGADEAPLDEVPLRPETVWLFPSARKSVVAHRGVVEVADSDALDVSALLLAAEWQDQDPRPLAHYMEQVRRRADPEQGGLAAFDDEPLLPPLSPAMLEAREKRQRAAHEAAEQQRVAAQRHIAETALAEIGIDEADGASVDALLTPSAEPDEVERLAAELPTITREDLDDGTADLPNLMAVSEQLLDAAKRKADAAKADADAQLAEARAALREDGGADADTADDDPEPDPALCEKLRAQVAGSPESAAGLGDGFDPDAFLAGLDGDGGGDGDESSPSRREAADRLSQAQTKMAESLLTGRQKSPEPVGPLETLSPRAAAFLGDLITDHLAAGGDLAGRDLAGANIRDIDLRGRDLTATLIERGNLKEGDLREVQGDGLVLAGADLSWVRLSEAVLTRVNLAQCVALGTSFSGSDLTGATLFDSDLRGARFIGARLADIQAMRTTFAEGDLSEVEASAFICIEGDVSHADLSRGRFTECIFIDTKMAAIRAREARFERCIFVNVTAEGADFRDAELPGCIFAGDDTSLSDARLARSDLRNASLRNQDVSGTDLRWARLDGADLGDSVLAGADLSGASLSGAIAMGASFEGAQMREVQGLKALLRKADLSAADLRRAVLYAAETSEASFANSRLDDADLTLVKLPRDARA